MYARYKSIIIKTKNHREADKLCEIFTLEQGIITAVLKGVRKKNSKLKYASQPFCFGEYDYVLSNGWYTVSGAELTESFYDLSYDTDKFFLGCLFLEFVGNGLISGCQNTDLFLTLLNALKELTYSDYDPYIVGLKFLLDALNDLGYRQSVTACAVCKNQGTLYFEAESGGLVCRMCRVGSDAPFCTASQNTLRFVSHTPWDRLKMLKLKNTDAVLRQVADSIARLFHKDFKSLANIR